MFGGMDIFINFCLFSSVQVYTKMLAKVAIFFIWVCLPPVLQIVYRGDVVTLRMNWTHPRETLGM